VISLLEPGKMGKFRHSLNNLKVLCTFVLCGILAAGLWPFHAPRNEVSWLSQRNGLLFGEYGSIVSASAFRANQSQADSSCSLEIWLEPSRVDSGGTILAFYWPESRVVPIALVQSFGDLVLQRTSQDQFHHAKKTQFYVDLFSHPKPVVVVISSGESGTTVYADGTIVRKSPNLRFSIRDLTGQLIVGSSPLKRNNWSGQLRGLTIYSRELSAGDVSKHYASFIESKHTELAKTEGAVARYLFNEGHGSVVQNEVDSATDLLIPERFFVLHEQFLKPFWEEFYGGWSYWRNICINIAGFIPLGFFFFAYLSLARRAAHPAAVTIALGLFVSLTIEVLQTFLPTRESGTTDLITNTLGTAVGVIAFRYRAFRPCWPRRGALH
jgi:hypothetical protein